MLIEKYKNIVIKIGSNTLMYMFEHDLFLSFVEDIRCIMKFARITIVTSGAIAMARTELNIQKPSNILQKQALSSIGQAQLMHKYNLEFQKYDINVGQILLTSKDIANPQALRNLQHTITALRKFNAIPIINENDALATKEIKIGDNDTLSACIAKAVEADLLIILTDVKGVYTLHPKNAKAKIITHTGILETEQFEGEELTQFGSGGMVTKVKAGNIALKNRCHAIIANGRKSNPLQSITEGQCTMFI